MRDLVTLVRQWLRFESVDPQVEREHEKVAVRLEEHERVISRMERISALRKSAHSAGVRMTR